MNSNGVPAKLRIAVVGCGSAGPAAAILLARQGHEVSLYERAPECRPVGAGFLLQPSGMAVLETLGILDEIIDHGSRVDRLHVLDAGGDDLLDLRYAELGNNRFGLGLHRPVLLHFLLKALEKEKVEIMWGHEVTGLERSDSGWRLSFADKPRATHFDLLIAADGTRSLLRERLGCRCADKSYPWGAHWFIGSNDGTFPEGDLHQIVDGTRRLAGFLGTGRNVGCDDKLVSLFWSIRLAEDQHIRSRPLGEWKDEIMRTVPRSEKLLSQITDWQQILTARYGDIRMKHWHGHDWVLLGDAAHAMSPQLGQGVNLALADAWFLSYCISRAPLREALHQYSRRRRFALRYYSLATRQLTPWFQSDHEFLTPLRKAFFRTMQHLPPARKFMTATMAGLIGNPRVQP